MNLTKLFLALSLILSGTLAAASDATYTFKKGSHLSSLLLEITLPVDCNRATAVVSETGANTYEVHAIQNAMQCDKPATEFRVQTLASEDGELTVKVQTGTAVKAIPIYWAK